MRKKAECAEIKSQWLFRKRQGFRILNLNDHNVPSCAHGPCLLFERKIDKEITERFFACAVHRSTKRCPFRLKITSKSITLDRNDVQVGGSSISNNSDTSFYYAAIRRKVNTMKSLGEDIYYCSLCNDIFTLPHIHSLKGPLKVADLRRPSRLLVSLTRNESESQYWFTAESLSVIVDAIEKSGSDGILCIGTPTVFEYYQSQKMLRQKYKSFLLDIDSRYVPFLRRSHFAVYSMLTNHFYDSASIAKLDEFFKSIYRLVMVCDPPFGVFVEALLNSLMKLREQFFSFRISAFNDSWCKSIIILPLYVGKHFLNHTDLHMLDYKICYANHGKYKRPEKSIVRLFTDLPLNAFDLSNFPEYRFCDLCEKFVSKTTLHCDKCMICPSEDNNTYEHCNRCHRCVKNIYKHCSSCNRCHLPQRCPKFGQTILKITKH